ncbi:MAG: D-glycero-beta-D-manno-heptose-7-phosphate kinase [Mesosutterella sp.]|nr:D-glycero-beta-D-manno-heptose-7-phosphate kinase [Mesosutterella sp.]
MALSRFKEKESPVAEPVRFRKILVVGDAMLDQYWFGDASRISPEAPVPVVRIARKEERLGGAANVARNIAALGGEASLLTVVGRDEAGEHLAKLLEAARVRPLLHFDPRLETTVKLRIIARQQQMLRVDFENLPHEEILLAHLGTYERELPSHAAVLLSDYGKGGLSHIKRMIELARAMDKPVLVDPKGSDYSRYEGASIITPNRAELAQVVGAWNSEDELTDKAQGLRTKLGLKALLLTRSEEGMTLFTERGRYSVPAQAREVYDVSGAGDTVIAVLASLMAAGVPLEKSVQVANRAGGIVVGKLGTATVSFQELFPKGVIE